MCQHPSRGLWCSDYSLSKLAAHHPHPGQSDLSLYQAHIEQHKRRKHHPCRAEMKIVEKLHYHPLRQKKEPFRNSELFLGQRFCNDIAESNLQMREETKHIRDAQRNQMGVGLCFQQLTCPSFSLRGAGGVHISMKLAMREPFHKTATQTCNAESNLSIQLIGPALSLQGR